MCSLHLNSPWTPREWLIPSSVIAVDVSIFCLNGNFLGQLVQLVRYVDIVCSLLFNKTVAFIIKVIGKQFVSLQERGYNGRNRHIFGLALKDRECFVQLADCVGEHMLFMVLHYTIHCSILSLTDLSSRLALSYSLLTCLWVVVHPISTVLRLEGLECLLPFQIFFRTLSQSSLFY